jgi:hypothetical protein
MHASEPAGQLRRESVGDALCTRCHDALAPPSSAAKHARHVEPAPSCISCHMPSVVYGLVAVQLSHRIEIPDATRQAGEQRPDACTLCHVDRTRSWAVDAARPRTAQAPPPQDPGALLGLSEVAYRLLAGDPIERAVAAHALGEPDAQFAASYQPQLLGLLAETLIADNYPAVRAIASRSLARRLRLQQPLAAATLDAFVATDALEQRRAVVAKLTHALGTGLTLPPEQLSARLRAQALDAAIEIGE